MNPLLAGLLIAAAVVLCSLVLSAGGGGTAAPQGGWISYGIIVVGLIVAINRFGAARRNKVTFGELFSYGFKATTMVVLLFVTFLFVLSLLTPELKQKALEATQLQLEKQGHSDGDIEKMIGLTRKYFWVVFIGSAMFFFVLVGTVGSLIGAAVTRKEPKNPFEQTGA